MNNNFIKKIIITFIFISFLIVFFLLVKPFTNNSRNKDYMSIVKNIVREKYDDVKLINDKYFYAFSEDDNQIIYHIFDLNGNRLYKIESMDELDIISVTSKYYITYDETYHVYNLKNEEIIKGNNIKSLNDYLIKVGNKIIDYKNEEKFKNVKRIKSFNDSKYFNINDYYIVDKHGDVILENAKIYEEIDALNKYFIVKVDDKYYTFFTSIDSIVGKGFDRYDKKESVYIKSNKKNYKIYSTGLRKEIKEEDYPINKKNIYFKNRYKSLNKDGKYTLYNDKGKVLISLSKQIVIDNEIKSGEIDKEFFLYDINKNIYVLCKRIIINDTVYYYTINKDYKIILDKKYNIKFKSKEFLSYDSDTIAYKNGEYIYFNNIDKNTINLYKTDSDDVLITNKIYKDILLIQSKEGIIFIDDTGEIFEELKNRKIIDYKYISDKGKLVIITEKDGLKGSYVAE